MLAIRGGREFRLSAPGAGSGVSCDALGLFVGAIPLLSCERRDNGSWAWVVRSHTELNAELTDCYGLPVDVAAKAAGLASVARALTRGDLASAQTITLHLHFPDPTPMAKGGESLPDLLRRAAALHWSGLLKGDWDPSKHPRTGTKPNPGRFAPVPQEPKLPRPGWPPRRVNVMLRRAA